MEGLIDIASEKGHQKRGKESAEDHSDLQRILFPIGIINAFTL